MSCCRLKMVRHYGLAAVICFTSILQLGIGYRILAICPSPWISHQLVFRDLTLALNKRGHELVVVAADPVNNPTLKNYTEIDISFVYDILDDQSYVENRRKVRFIDTIMQVHEPLLVLLDGILSQPDLAKLYAPSSNEKFDLLLVESVGWSGLYPFATRFGVPIVGFSAMGMNINIHFEIGNPISSSSMSHHELETELSEQPSFWRRLRHFYTIWKYLYWFRTTLIPKQQVLARKYFGSEIPDLSDLAKNVSLHLVNQQRAISYARPNVPKVIEIGGFHVTKQSPSLSEELKEILDDAAEGFVYMSLGTNAKSTMMPQRTIEQFIAAFSKLPYKVIWKFENDDLPGKPDNVHTRKWVPQQAILAHPNLKVFVYQGGAQSTHEAVHHAVPLVGIPILGDQDMQVHRMASLGVAKKLEITTLTAGELFEAISTVASDISYKQRMKSLRSLMVDTQQDPLENAMWWIEHVIRHRGAPHLRSSTADEPWHSRQDMDIVAFISVVFVIVLGLATIASYYLVKRIYTICFRRKLGKKKIN